VLCRLDYRKEVQEHVYGNNPTHAKLRIHQVFYKRRELEVSIGQDYSILASLVESPLVASAPLVSPSWLKSMEEIF